MVQNKEKAQRKRIAESLFVMALLAISAATLHKTVLPIAYSEPAKGNGESCSNLEILTTMASAFRAGYPSENVLDENLETRWSKSGIGVWIIADMGSEKMICSVDIAWFRGDQRIAYFSVSVSTDGSAFTHVFDGQSSGKTLEAEGYDLSPDVTARYVKITVNGNTENKMAGITELDIRGIQSVDAPGETDTTPPSITAPPDKVATAAGTLTSVFLGSPIVSDNVDSTPTVTNSAPLLGFPVGQTLVTWTAKDDAGNTAKDIQMVSVVIPAPPGGGHDYEVVITDSGYNPRQLDVIMDAGKKLKFSNMGTFAHSIASGFHGGIDPNHGVLVEADLEPGESVIIPLVSHPFMYLMYNNTLPVHCHFHGPTNESVVLRITNPPPAPPEPPTSPTKEIMRPLWLPYASLQGQLDAYKPVLQDYDWPKLRMRHSSNSIPADDLAAFMSLKGNKLLSVTTLEKVKTHTTWAKTQGFAGVEYNIEGRFDAGDTNAQIREAASVVHGAGLKFVSTPTKAILADNWETIADLADIVHIQAQTLQDNPNGFDTFVADWVKKLKTRNPNIIVTVQTGTGEPAAPGMSLLETFQKSTDLVVVGPDAVDGVSVWFGGGEEELMESYFKWYHQKYRSGTTTTDQIPTVPSTTYTPTSPTQGQTITFSAGAIDDIGLTKIELFVDGSSIASCPVSGESNTCTKTSTRTAGSYTYFARATDTNGQVGQSATKSFTVGTSTPVITPPTTSISHSPSSPTPIQSVTLSATASDEVSLTKVEVFVDGASIGSCAVSGVSSTTCTIATGPYTTGSTHTYYSKATDNSNLVGQSATKSFAVQGVPAPTPTTGLPSAQAVYSSSEFIAPASVDTFIMYMANEFHEGEGQWKMLSGTNEFFIPQHLTVHAGTKISFHMADARWGSHHTYKIVIKNASGGTVHTTETIGFPDKANANSQPVALPPGTYTLDYIAISGSEKFPHMNGEQQTITVLSTPKDANGSVITGGFYSTTNKAANMYNGDGQPKLGWLGYYQTEFPARGLDIASIHSFAYYSSTENGKGTTQVCQFDQMAGAQSCVFPGEGGASWHDNKSGEHTLVIWKNKPGVTLQQVWDALDAMTIQNTYI